jgi:hypothetical protein
VFGKFLEPSPIFAKSYLSEALFRYSTLGWAPSLTHKHYTRLEMLARDKDSSLLYKFVNYSRKRFITLAPEQHFLLPELAFTISASGCSGFLESLKLFGTSEGVWAFNAVEVCRIFVVDVFGPLRCGTASFAKKFLR